MKLSIIFDAIVCVCLLVGFIYTLWFNKRLVAAHNNQRHFQNLLDTFSTALERGQKSLTQLQETNKTITEDMNQKMSKASSLLEDLRFFSDRGENIMDHLENQIRIARTIKNEFENLVRLREEKIETEAESDEIENKAKADAKIQDLHQIEAEVEKSPEPEHVNAFSKKSFGEEVPPETIFKTKARLDHPWGILQQKETTIIKARLLS